MENITSYFTTILCVFICLSSVFIFTQLARVFINKKKINQKFKSRKGFRYDRDFIEARREEINIKDNNNNKNKSNNKKLKEEKYLNTIMRIYIKVNLLMERKWIWNIYFFK